MMYCRNCGSILAEEDRFCGQCGTPVERATSASSAMHAAETENTENAPHSGVEYSFVKPDEPKKSKGLHSLPLCMLSTLCGIVSIVFLLSDWFRVSYSTVFQRGIVQIPLFRIGLLDDLLKNVIGIQPDAALIPIDLAAIGLGVAVLLIVLGLIGAWTGKSRLCALALTGNLLGFFSALFIMLYTTVFGIILRRYFVGYAEEGISLTMMPFPTLLLFAVGVMLSVMLLRGCGKRNVLPPIFISAIGAIGVLGVALLILIGTQLFFGRNTTPAPQEIMPGDFYNDFFGGRDQTDSYLPR